MVGIENVRRSCDIFDTLAWHLYRNFLLYIWEDNRTVKLQREKSPLCQKADSRATQFNRIYQKDNFFFQ